MIIVITIIIIIVIVMVVIIIIMRTQLGGRRHPNRDQLAPVLPWNVACGASLWRLGNESLIVYTTCTYIIMLYYVYTINRWFYSMCICICVYIYIYIYASAISGLSLHLRPGKPHFKLDTLWLFVSLPAGDLTVLSSCMRLVVLVVRLCWRSLGDKFVPSILYPCTGTFCYLYACCRIHCIWCAWCTRMHVCVCRYVPQVWRSMYWSSNRKHVDHAALNMQY